MLQHCSMMAVLLLDREWKADAYMPTHFHDRTSEMKCSVSLALTGKMTLAYNHRLEVEFLALNVDLRV